MLHEDKIWIATKATGEAICLLPQKANRHVLITGLSNKEVDRTARILAEGFSSLGTPVFITDINRDLEGMMAQGMSSESIQETVSCMELEKVVSASRVSLLPSGMLVVKRGFPFVQI